MSGVTSANVMKLHAELKARLNNEVRAGRISEQDAQRQVFEFEKTNNKAIQEYNAAQVTTQADAEQEASDAAASAFGLTRSADTSAQAEEGQHAQKKKEYTPMQELLLKQGQAKYPDNDVVLDDKGQIVVKDKKTGEIDKAKTEEAKKIKVDGSTSEVTIKEGDADPDVKMKAPTKESAESMKKYDTKDEAHQEFTTGSKEDFDKAKADYKELGSQVKDKEKELKQLEKDFRKTRGEAREQAAAARDKARAELQELRDKELKAKNEYAKQKALYKNGGERGIARAARHNEKNYDNVADVHRVFINKDEEKAYLKEHPEEKGHTETLSSKQEKTLYDINYEAKRQIKLAEKACADAKDEASRKKAEEELEYVTKMYGDLADCYDPKKGEIDTEKLKNGLMTFTGGDARLNIDEKTEMSSKFGASKAKITSLVKELGFGNESATARRFGAAGAAAAATALGSLIGNHKHSATSEAHSSVTETAEATAKDEQLTRQVFKYMDSSGKPIMKEISAYAKAEATATASATATADAVARAVAKVPLFGQLAGPAIAGVAAFIIANPQSKDAFNGNSVETVLENLNCVSGKDNKKIVAQIQDMKITGDEVRDKAIKAAVIQAALGGESAKANTEELLAAYQNLKDTKAAIDKIQSQDEPTVPPEEHTVPPEPPVPPEDPCTRREERTSHGDVIPSREVRGHGQSPYWISNAYIGQDGSELTLAQRKEVQKLLNKDENRQVQEKGNFNGSKIGYRYRKEITLSDGTVVKLADDAAKRIGTGKTTKTRVAIKNGRQITEVREVDCKTGKPVDGPTGQWHVVK